MTGRKPELSPDCAPLTATTKPPVWLGQNRYVEGVTPADRMLHGVLVFAVKEFKTIGRRHSLEIRVMAKEFGP